MKRLFLLLFCLSGVASVHAQIHEIGVFLGGSNYIGDVGPTTYINPHETAYGILYKWNRSPRHSWRFSYTQSKITSRDTDSDIPGRALRGYDFENNLKEFSAGMEFNFFDFNLHDGKRKITPYVYSGLSYFGYEELFVLVDGTHIDYKEGALAIPMIVGIKGTIAENFILGAEIGARYTFTDNLDGSNPKNENLAILQFGNTNSKDWFVFTGITLTYTFGNKPCYCAE